MHHFAARCPAIRQPCPTRSELPTTFTSINPKPSSSRTSSLLAATSASTQSVPQNVITNKYGSFDVVPQPGEILVPVNSLTSSGRFSLNLRLSKTFGFGQKKEPVNAGAGGPGAGGTFGRGPGGPGGGGPRGGGGFGGRGGGGMDGGATNNRYKLTVSRSARNGFNNV